MGEWRRFDFKREKFIELMLYFSKRGLDERLVIGSTDLLPARVDSSGRQSL